MGKAGTGKTIDVNDRGANRQNGHGAMKDHATPKNPAKNRTATVRERRADDKRFAAAVFRREVCWTPLYRVLTPIASPGGDSQ
jgi:hypothetical protein